MDVIALHQAGFTNAVASLGTALTAGHAALIKRYVNEVYLTYDSDEAGTKAALRAVPILKEAGITARVIRMDPYKDPDEFIKNLGAEAFEERISKARNGFLFSLEILEKNYDMTSPEGKTDFMKETARKLAEIEEEIERNNYIEAVARTYRVGYEELRKLVAKMAIQSGLAKPAEKPKSTRNKEKEDGNLKSQRIILTWLIEDKTIFNQIRKYIKPDDFTEELYQTVAQMVYEQYEAGMVNPAQIMNHFPDGEEHRKVAELFHTRIRELATVKEQEKALKETIIKVKDYSIEVATKRLAPTDIQGLQKLMEAKRALQDLQKLHISIN
jgi:DNA primase